MDYDVDLQFVYDKSMPVYVYKKIMLRDGFDEGVFVENGVKGYYSGQVRREQSEIRIS